MADRERLEDVLGDWYERRERDDDLAPEDLVREHPDLADEIRSHFAFAGLMERALERPDTLPADHAQTIGEYRILREIGRGGMGVVYEAEQTSMGRRVALKVLSPAVTSVHQAIERFRREARAAGQIHHTSIVPVHAMGEDRGLWYYAMELVEGETLAEIVTAMRDRQAGDDPSAGEGRLGLSSANGAGWARLAGAFAGVAEALEAAHREGIIHRDVKPTNLLLALDGTLKLVDFGLARLMGEGASMTMTGQLLGTPHYMSPEQAMARQVPIDHRTDVYSLGATLYEVLALRTPFQGDSLQEICSQILAREPVSIRKASPRVPRDLETIVLKAMEKDRERRYASAAEMARDLRRFAEGAPIRARRIGPVARAWRRVKRNKVRAALVAAVVLLATVGGLLAWRASVESARRAELEYAVLCAHAEEAIARTMEPLRASDHASGSDPGESTDEILLSGGSGLASGTHGAAAARDLFGRAIALLPDRHEAYLGRALAPGRTTEERLADLDAARDRGIPDGIYWLGRAHLLRAVGRREEAADAEARAPDRVETGTEAYLRGRLAAAGGRSEHAIELLGGAVDAPDAGPAVRYLARRLRAALSERRGEFAAALQDAHALEAMGVDRPAARLLVARLWLRMGREDRAEAAFEEALEAVRVRDTPEAWFALIVASWVAHSWTDRATSEAHARHPDHPAIARLRADALRGAGRLREALAIADRMTSTRPEDHDGYELRGVVLADLGPREEARSALERAVEMAPSCLAARRSLGVLLVNDFLAFEEGLTHLDRALELAPFDPGVHGNRAVSLARLGRVEEAVAASRRAVELAPRSVVDHDRLWLLLRKAHRDEEARDAVASAAARPGRDPGTLHVRAHALQWLDRPEEALAAVDAALATRPGELSCLLLDRAKALSRLARYGQAHAAIDEALAAAPGSGQAKWAERVRGHVLHAEGRWEEAAEAYGRAAELCEPAERASWLTVRGIVLRNLGRLDAALALFRRVVEMSPGYAHGRAEMAGCLIGLGRLDEAERALGGLEERDPGHGCLQFQRGRLLEARGRPEGALESYERAIARNPRHDRALVNAGVILVGLGRLDEALVAYARAAEIDPRSATPHVNRGVVLSSLGKVDEALSAYDDALRLDPRCAVTHSNRATALQRLERHEEALAAADEAIRLEPDRASPYAVRGDALFARGEFASAEAAYRRAVELKPDPARWHLGLGRALLSLARLEEAVAACEAAIEREPDLLAAHVKRGQILLLLGQHDEARSAYERALAIEPGNAEALRGLGAALVNLGRPDEALVALEGAIEADPVDGIAHAFRAGALFDQGKKEAALAEAGRAVELSPGIADPHRLRGLILARLGRLEDALQAYDRAIEIQPRTLLVHHNRTDVLLGLGRWREALEANERSAEVRPSVRGIPDYWGRRASALVNLGEAEAALRDYEKALSMAPRFAPYHVGKARALHRLERFPDAVRAADAAIEIDPDNADAWCARGCALDVLGNFTEALAAFDRTAALVPRDPAAHLNRALVLGRLGRPEDCLSALERTLALDPGSCPAHKLRAQVLQGLGRPREAVAAWTRVIELDARLLEARLGRAWCRLMIGRPEGAIVDFDEALRLRPPPMQAAQVHCGRAGCLSALGRYEKAVAEEDGADRLFPAHAALCGIRGRALLDLGRFDEARKAAERLGGNPATQVSLKLSILRRQGRDEETRRFARAHLDEDPERFGHVFLAILCAHAGEDRKARDHLRAAKPTGLPGEAFNRSCAHALLGDADEAIRWLERALEAGLRLAPNAPPDPDFTELKSDPRYRALMEKMHRPRPR